MAKKVVLKLDLHDDKDKQKAMKAVSKLQGLDSIAMDMKDRKLTATGLIDPVDVVNKLRKYWRTEIVSVGPAKEPEKKDEQKKDQNNGGKKEGGGGDKKKEASDPIADYINDYWTYYNHHRPPYHVQSAEENPNACVIC